jgi:hypothetical protein
MKPLKRLANERILLHRPEGRCYARVGLDGKDSSPPGLKADVSENGGSRGKIPLICRRALMRMARWEGFASIGLKADVM